MIKRTLAGLLAIAAVALASPLAAQTSISLGGNLILSCGAATASAGAATLANKCGVITSEALTTAAAAEYTLTLTNTTIAAGDICFAGAALGTSTQGTVTSGGAMKTTANTGVVAVSNVHASEALNGTITIVYWCLK